MFNDVLKFVLVHFEKFLKGFHTKKDELLERGWTKNSVLDPYFFAYLAMIETVSDPKNFTGYNARS